MGTVEKRKAGEAVRERAALDSVGRKATELYCGEFCALKLRRGAAEGEEREERERKREKGKHKTNEGKRSSRPFASTVCQTAMRRSEQDRGRTGRP